MLLYKMGYVELFTAVENGSLYKRSLRPSNFTHARSQAWFTLKL
jgi:hypothetical protein